MAWKSIKLREEIYLFHGNVEESNPERHRLHLPLEFSRDRIEEMTAKRRRSSSWICDLPRAVEKTYSDPNARLSMAIDEGKPSFGRRPAPWF